MMLINSTPELKGLRDENLELGSVKMAILWQKLQELDVYSLESVRTIKGGNAEIIADTLRRFGVPVEVMD